MDWQPIETAPKDGAEILGVDIATGDVSVYSWFPKWYGRDCDGDDLWMGVNLDEEYGGTIKLTHWMPLPEPPKCK